MRNVKLDMAKVLALHAQGWLPKDIATVTHSTSNSISRALTRAGVVRKKNRQHRLNESFFDNIDTEEKAYWLGFVITDGSVDRYSISVELSEVDGSHLEKLSKALGSDAPLYRRTNNGGTKCARLRVFSVHMVRSLAQLGVVPRKTYVAVPPTLPEHLSRHFWRGCIDGDGCIHVTDSHLLIGFVGTEAMVRGFKGFCSTLSGVGNPSVRPVLHKNAFSIHYNGNRSPKAIVEELYRDATIYLDRKFTKKEEALRW